MTKETIIGRIVTSATETQLAQIKNILDGKETATATATPTDRRLLNIRQVAKETGLSKTTIWRLINEGILPTVEIRAGRRRVPSEAVTSFINRRNRNAPNAG